MKDLSFSSFGNSEAMFKMNDGEEERCESFEAIGWLFFIHYVQVLLVENNACYDTQLGLLVIIDHRGTLDSIQHRLSGDNPWESYGANRLFKTEQVSNDYFGPKLRRCNKKS